MGDLVTSFVSAVSEFLKSFGVARMLLLVIVLVTVGMFLYRRRFKSLSGVNQSIFEDVVDRGLGEAGERLIEAKRLTDERRFFVNLKYGVTALVVIIFVTYSVFFVLRFPVSNSPAEWGQMGDFFGGMLNPILAFASFIALLYTIRIQSEELRLTRKELKNSVRAQADIAQTAKTQLLQVSLIEDYKYVATKIRNQSERCNQIIETPFTVHLNFRFGGVPFTAGSVYELLAWLSFQFGITDKDDTGTAEESLKKARAWMVENISNDVQVEALFHVKDFLSNARVLNQVVSSHSKICEELKIMSGPGSVSELDIGYAAEALAKAYMLSVVFDSFISQSFIPTPNKVREYFVACLTNWGLTLVIDTSEN